MVDGWEIAKTLAGPIATIVAAVAAVYVTNKFAKRQTAIAEAQKDIAQSQRDIAYDKLKHDLFDKRYEIYQTAKLIVERLSGSNFDRSDHDPELRAMRIKLDEARFFFPPKETRLFSTIEKLAADHEIARVGLKHSADDDLSRVKAGEEAANALMQLVKIYENLPDLLEAELGFSQLRQRRE